MPKGNPNPKRENLRVQKTNWKHLPTKAVRIPKAFETQILELALELDSGKLQTRVLSPLGLEQHDTAESQKNTKDCLYETLLKLSLTDLLKIQLELPLIIEQKKEQTRDRRLETAILFLAERCDGAHDMDGQGFNKIDVRFGKWLLSRIVSKQLIKSHAESALKMIGKYKGQLERGGIALPIWEEIEHQYPETHRLRAPDEELPAHRIEVKGNKIAVYAPYDSTGRFQKTAKSIEGYAFSNSDKGWYFPMERVEEVLSAFKEGYEVDPNIEGAIALLKQQQEEERAAKEQGALEKSLEIIRLINAADLDAPLANGWHLRDYQKRGVEWLLAHRQGGIYRGGILADDMGLGKSLVALVAARAMQKTFDCPVFVVAPVSVLDNWMREASRAEVRIETCSWAKLPKPLETSRYVLIADEAHMMQSGEQTKRGREALELAKHENCLAAWMLSGTPLKNGRPINLYPLLDAVGHKLANDKWGYQKYFCRAHQKAMGKKSFWDTTGAAHLDELAKKTEDVILRRTKTECLPELPEKTRLFKEVELETKEASAYQKKIRELVENYRQRAKEGKVDADAEALVTLNILRKVGSEAKVRSAIALAEELLEQGQQVVLFTEFVESAKAIHEALGGELLTGESKDRQAMIDRFQSGESKIFVGTIKAGGVGITLTAASNVILVDRPWTSADALQAEDRCWRLGQQNAVFTTWLQLGDIDKAIDSLLLSKQERIELVLKGKRKTLQGLDSPKDLARELLAIL